MRISVLTITPMMQTRPREKYKVRSNDHRHSPPLTYRAQHEFTDVLDGWRLTVGNISLVIHYQVCSTVYKGFTSLVIVFESHCCGEVWCEVRCGGVSSLVSSLDTTAMVEPLAAP